MESIAQMVGDTTIKSKIIDLKISEDMDKLIAKREVGK